MESKTIRVWDLPLRCFHWLLVISIVSAYITSELGGLWLDWHSHGGTFTLALVVFRIIWGFIGSTYARFSSFVPTPTRLRAFFSSTRPGIGHNPLGALSIIAILSVILIQAGLGLFAMNDEIEFHGPLYELVNSTWSERLTAWHSLNFNVLLLLIGMHVSAVAYYTWIQPKTLVTPMITGNTTVGPEVHVDPINGGGKMQFIFAGTVAGLVFWAIESGALTEWLSPQLVSTGKSLTAW